MSKIKNKNIIFQERLNQQLSENYEPDFEDFYLAEIEAKANILDGLIKYLEDKIEECNKYIAKGESVALLLTIRDNYQKVLDKANGGIDNDKDNNNNQSKMSKMF